MTVQVKREDFSVKTKRKKHPNEVNYPCMMHQGSIEVFTRFLSCLDDSQIDELAEGTLILEEEETAELFDEIKEGDVIGCNVDLPDKGRISGQWVVDSIGDDVLHCHARFKEDYKVDIYFEDVSVALAMGLAEILIRDGKFYGVSEYEERKVTLLSPYSNEELQEIYEYNRAVGDMISEGSPIHPDDLNA